MLTRMTIILSESERAALQRMAETDYRFPRDVVRCLISEAARARGILPHEQTEGAPTRQDDRPSVKHTGP